MAFEVLWYFPLQSGLSLLNLVLSSMKWSFPYLTRPQTIIEDQRSTLYMDPNLFKLYRLYTERRGPSENCIIDNAHCIQFLKSVH